MYAESLIKGWAEENRLRAPEMRNKPAFYRNLEQALDHRREEQALLGLRPRWDESVADFTTCDFLSLSRSGRVREAFLAELARHPNFDLGAAGSRVQYGNYSYLNEVEQEIAAFHGVETVYMTQSGFAANVAVLSGILLPGDAIVYDELVHASSHDGFNLSLAEHKLPFRHNDPDALREVLSQLKESQPDFRSGIRSLLVCVESIYSMDGDVCLLEEILQVVKEEFPLGNAQILMDEAHSLGVIGENGRGLVSMLGLEKEIAIRIHVASKALGSVGGLVLCNNTIRYMLLNFSRSVAFSCAPSFPMVASIISGYRLLMSGETREEQELIQRNVKHFFTKLTASAYWDEAEEEGILSIPLLEGWEMRPFQTHIVPLRTQPGHEMLLFFQFVMNNMNAYPMVFPIVPKGESRVRLVFHSHNTLEQIDSLVSAISDWAGEMLAIHRGEANKVLPDAARRVYAIQRAA